MRVYIAGPYSSNPDENTAFAMAMGNVLLSLGFAPYIPHLCHFWHAQYPRPYEDWMRMDLEFVKVCDLVFRLPGYSPGADREVELAQKCGIPVFLSISDILTYCEFRKDIDEMAWG